MVAVDKFHDFVDLFGGLDQAEADEGVLDLFAADESCLLAVKRVEGLVDLLAVPFVWLHTRGAAYWSSNFTNLLFPCRSSQRRLCVSFRMAIACSYSSFLCFFDLMDWEETSISSSSHVT